MRKSLGKVEGVLDTTIIAKSFSNRGEAVSLFGSI